MFYFMGFSSYGYVVYYVICIDSRFFVSTSLANVLVFPLTHSILMTITLFIQNIRWIHFCYMVYILFHSVNLVRRKQQMNILILLI